MLNIKILKFKMKKLILMFALMMGFAVYTNAQTALVDNGTAKDNWYLGGGIGTNVWNDVTSWQLFNAKSVVNDGKTNSWWRTQPLHVNVTFGKMLTPYLGFEVDYAMAFNLRGQSKFLDAHNLTGNVVLNLNNIVNGYSGSRRFFEVELLGGAGWLHNFNGSVNGLTVRGAFRGNFNVNKSFAVIVTPEYVWTPKNIGDIKTSVMGVNLSVGVKWRIPTQRGNFPKWALRDQSEIDALNSQINTLQETNANLSKANADLAEALKKALEDGNKVEVKVQNVKGVNFEKGKSEVDNETISKLASQLKNTNGTIVLTGTTSPEGKEVFNKNLATERAKAVKDKLVELGIDSKRITIKDGYEYQRSVIISVE